MSGLQGREREVLVRHCLQGEELRTLAREWSLSPARVTSIHAAAARKLRILAVGELRRSLSAEFTVRPTVEGIRH